MKVCHHRHNKSVDACSKSRMNSRGKIGTVIDRKFRRSTLSVMFIEHRSLMASKKPEAIWNIDCGRQVAEILASSNRREIVEIVGSEVGYEAIGNRLDCSALVQHHGHRVSTLNSRFGRAVT